MSLNNGKTGRNGSSLKRSFKLVRSIGTVPPAELAVSVFSVLLISAQIYEFENPGNLIRRAVPPKE